MQISTDFKKASTLAQAIQKIDFWKGKKKRKNLIAAKSDLVGMKGYFKTYNRVKYFLPYLIKPFLNETAFYAKFSGRFLVLKPKSRD